MGSSNYYRPPGPCANCGKEHGGFMGSSAWGHSEMCCGNACGKRLQAKLKNGMVPAGEYEYDNALNLRIRIKQLAAQVKSLTAALRQEESK